MLAFVIWTLMGIIFVGMGIYDMCSKKEQPFGFWANAKTLPMQDVRGYNKALGKLWCAFGIGFILIGLPLLSDRNSALVMIPILGAMAEAIITMAVYVTVIEKKYQKK